MGPNCICLGVTLLAMRASARLCVCVHACVRRWQVGEMLLCHLHLFRGSRSKIDQSMPKCSVNRQRPFEVTAPDRSNYYLRAKREATSTWDYAIKHLIFVQVADRMTFYLLLFFNSKMASIRFVRFNEKVRQTYLSVGEMILNTVILIEPREHDVEMNQKVF